MFLLSYGEVEFSIEVLNGTDFSGADPTRPDEKIKVSSLARPGTNYKILVQARPFQFSVRTV